MKNIIRSLLGGLAAIFLAVVAQAAGLAPGAFSAGSITGDVSYKLAGTTEYIPLTAGTSIPQGATIKTGPGSVALIVFASGSTASIRPNSEIEITKFEQEAFAGPVQKGFEPAVSNTQIKVLDGEVAASVAKLKKGSEFVVTSPVGAAGVRGTIFSVSYNRATGAFSVKTAEGAVIFTANTGGPVAPVLITALQMVIGNANQLAGPGAITPALVALPPADRAALATLFVAAAAGVLQSTVITRDEPGSETPTPPIVISVN